MKNYLKKITVLAIVNTLFVMPCFSLDLDSTVTDKDRTNLAVGVYTITATDL